MVWHRRLLAAGLLIVGASTTLANAAWAARSDNCVGVAVFAGCPTISADLGADQLNLVGSANVPGTGGTGGTKTRAPAGGAAADPNGCAITVGVRCRGFVPKPGDPARTVLPATPAITLRDLASFRPAPGTQQMEPDGWVVAGLDANFFAIVDQQLVPGMLLGQPATVRFTPVGYHWSYGDGAAVVRSTKGGTWAQLGLADFEPTPTSHVYAREGEYVIRLTIDFRAEYRFGSRVFVPVAGTIALPANDLLVTVTGAKTVLVDRDCLADPGGPGC